MLLEDLGWEGSRTAPLVNSPWMRYCCLSLQEPAADLNVAIRLADQALLGALQARETQSMLGTALFCTGVKACKYSW